MDILITDNGDGGDVVLREPITMQHPYPMFIDVMGAGDAIVNGRYVFDRLTYTEEEAYQGYRPTFKKGNLEIVFFVGVWRIDDRGFTYYYSEGTGFLPDKSGWSVYDGAPDAPTLAHDTVDFPTTNNADLHTDTGIGTAVYTSLFDAPGWMEGFKTPEEKVPGLGEFERALDAPITAGGISRIKRVAASQLQWLLEDGVCSSLSVEVRNPELGRIEVDITATEPNDVQNRYKLLWNREEQKLIGFLRAPDRASVILED